MPSLQAIKLIAVLVVAAGIAIGSAWLTHAVDSAHLAKIEAGYAKAETQAAEISRLRQAAEDKVSLDAAVKEAAAQQQIMTVTNTVIREIPSHVPLASKCAVTVGFVRVLNAIILGGGTADLSYSPGQSDDACAATDPRTLALNIAANYTAALRNAEQLTALQSWVREQQAVRTAKPTK